jgi:hypothetical protein
VLLLILLSLPPFGFSLSYWIGITLFFYFLLRNQTFKLKHIFIFFYFIQFISLIWIIQSFSSGGWGYLILGVILISFLAGFIAFLHLGSIQFIYYFFREKNLLPFLITFKSKHHRFIKRIYYWWDFHGIPLQLFIIKISLF